MGFGKMRTKPDVEGRERYEALRTSGVLFFSRLLSFKMLSALRLFCQGIFMFWTVELQYPGERNCPLLYGVLDYYYLQFRKSTRSWGKRET